MKRYDVLIIGAGQAGVPLAEKFAQEGKKVALIEKRAIGGTCINDGCTPTKAMISSAHAAHRARKADALGIMVHGLEIDFKKVKQRKDDLVNSSRSSVQKKLESTKGLDLIFGEATFSGEKQIKVSQAKGSALELSADWIFINTGAQPNIPKIKGLDQIHYLNSTSLLDTEEIPDHLLILGGSYLSLEFAQMFHRFGSKVTILEKSSRILMKEDLDVSQEITKILLDEGLKILCNTRVIEAKDKKGTILLTCKKGADQFSIHGSHLLLAAGRRPQTELLNLEIPGIKTDDRGYIQVNKKLETTVKGIYALGDVKGGPAFTHIAYHDHIIVYQNLMKQGKLTDTNRPIPYCLFTDPQLGRIGLTEAQAKEKGIPYELAKIPNSQVARGIQTGETLGFLKAIVDPKSRKILGASILASEGGEIMAVIQMAMQGNITYDQLQEGIFAHPTYAEALNNLFVRLHTKS